jgi:hypothetical protein
MCLLVKLQTEAPYESVAREGVVSKIGREVTRYPWQSRRVPATRILVNHQYKIVAGLL